MAVKFMKLFHLFRPCLQRQNGNFSKCLEREKDSTSVFISSEKNLMGTFILRAHLSMNDVSRDFATNLNFSDFELIKAECRVAHTAQCGNRHCTRRSIFNQGPPEQNEVRIAVKVKAKSHVFQKAHQENYYYRKLKFFSFFSSLDTNEVSKEREELENEANLHAFFRVRAAALNKTKIAKNEIKKTRKDFFFDNLSSIQVQQKQEKRRRGERLQPCKCSGMLQAMMYQAMFFVLLRMLSAQASTTAEKESPRKIFLTVSQILYFLSFVLFIAFIVAPKNDGPRWHKNQERIHNSSFGIHNVLIVALCLRLKALILDAFNDHLRPSLRFELSFFVLKKFS